MQAKYLLKRPEAKAPFLTNSKAAGFDLAAAEEVIIPAKKVGSVPLGVVVVPPPGYFTILAARSSLHKRGLMLANGIGVIDADYSGPEDELIAKIYNFSDQDVTIEVGDRIIQGIFQPQKEIEFIEVLELTNQSRGAFGTSGIK